MIRIQTHHKINLKKAKNQNQMISGKVKNLIYNNSKSLMKEIKEHMLMTKMMIQGVVKTHQRKNQIKKITKELVSQ